MSEQLQYPIVSRHTHGRNGHNPVLIPSMQGTQVWARMPSTVNANQPAAQNDTEVLAWVVGYERRGSSVSLVLYYISLMLLNAWMTGVLPLQSSRDRRDLDFLL